MPMGHKESDMYTSSLKQLVSVPKPICRHIRIFSINLYFYNKWLINYNMANSTTPMVMNSNYKALVTNSKLFSLIYLEWILK